MPFVLTRTAINALKDGLSTADPDEAIPWFHLRRNAYIDADSWDGLTAEQQLVVRAQVISAASSGVRMLSHCAAAAVWGIPLIGKWPKRVDVLVEDNTHGTRPDIQRRRTQNMPRGRTMHGMTLTSPERTAVDLARIGSLATGVAALDHVLHHHLATRLQLHAEVDAIPKGGRGKRRARLAVTIARQDSESAAESLSRARLFELGIPQPALQVNFTDSRGFIGRVDMYWPHIDVVGEVDGRLKYSVPPGDSPDKARDIVWREKLREDRLHAVTSRVLRWTWDDATNSERFRLKLASAGLRASHDPSWLELISSRGALTVER